jgi:hypothetical protein
LGLKLGSFSDARLFESSTSVASFALFPFLAAARHEIKGLKNVSGHSANPTSQRIRGGGASVESVRKIAREKL